jgi:hypothetical protein
MPVVVITKEEYDALGDEKYSDGNIYLISDDVGDWTATGVVYDNKVSGLEATNVGAALDELDKKIDDIIGGSFSSDSAEKDGNGNNIVETYETKTDANQKLIDAKSYADDVKNDLLNGAGAAYDTLKELGELIDDNHDAIDAVNELANKKQDASTAINTGNIANQSVKHATTADGLTGVTASATELNYMDGVTSPVQTQLDGLNTNINELNSDLINLNKTLYLSPIARYQQPKFKEYKGLAVLLVANFESSILITIDTNAVSSALSTNGYKVNYLSGENEVKRMVIDGVVKETNTIRVKIRTNDETDFIATAFLMSAGSFVY